MAGADGRPGSSWQAEAPVPLKIAGTSKLFRGPIVEQIGLKIQRPQFDLLDRKFEPERSLSNHSCWSWCTALIFSGAGVARAWGAARSFSAWRRSRPS